MKGEKERPELQISPVEQALFVLHDGEPCIETWKTIFDSRKYSQLYAISYVSSPRFLTRLVEAFDSIEVILGIDSNEALQKIDDLFQGGNVKFFNGLSESLRDKAVDKSFMVRYSNMNEPIHSKIYLMKDGEGNTRVVLGSINLTENALTERGKHQYEEAQVYDNSPLFKHYWARFEAIKKHTLDFLPSASIEKWREERETIDVSQEGELAKAVSADLEKKDMKQTFASFEADFKEIEKRQAVGDQNISTSEMQNYKIIKQLKSRSKKKFDLKTGPSLQGAIKKVTSVLNVDVLADIREPIPYLLSVPQDDGHERFYYATPATDQAPQQIGEAFFEKPLTPDQISSALENIESFVGTYRKYTINDVSDDYPQWIYEAILYTMTAPMIERIRMNAADDLHDDSILSDIPIYMVLGGRAGSGKTHLLGYLFKLLSGEQPCSSLWQFIDLKKKDAYGAHLERAFETGNRFPLFVDEAAPTLFKGAGDAAIKNLANSLKDKQHYAPIICTTNASDYSPNEGSVRRLKYLPLDEVFDTGSNEGREAFSKVINGCNNALEKDFLVRFDEALLTGEKAYDEKRDYLSLTRKIVLGYYEEAQRDVPKYFPRMLIDKSTIEGKRRWQQLYDDESKRNVFVPIDNGARLRVEVDNLFNFKPTQRQRNEYADSLPPAVAKSKAGKYVELNTEQFFQWIECPNPYEKHGLLEKLKRAFE